MNEYYIVSGLITKPDKNEIIWISNINPLIWTNDITKAKKYESYASVISELEQDKSNLIILIKYTDLKNIFIQHMNYDGLILSEEIYEP